MANTYEYSEHHERFRGFLKELGMSQKEFSDAMGYPVSNRVAVSICKSKAKGVFPANLVRVMNFIDYLKNENKVLFP